MNKAMTMLNIGKEAAVDYLKSIPGLEPTKEMSHNSKITDAQFEALQKKFHAEGSTALDTSNIPFRLSSESKAPKVTVVGKIDLDSINQSTRPKKKSKEERRREREEKAAQNNQSTPVRHRNRINVDDSIKEERLEIMAHPNEQITKTIQIRITQLRFDDGYITFSTGNDTFVCRRSGFSQDLNKHKNDPRIRDFTAQIILDYSKGTFEIVDKMALRKLEEFRDKVNKETFERHLKDVEREKEEVEPKRKRPRIKVAKDTMGETMVNAYKKQISILTSSLKFGSGRVVILYDKRRYIYKDNRLDGYDDIIERVNDFLNKSGKKPIKSFLVKVELNFDAGSFSFVDFDVFKYVIV